jgi:hypothetical protein
VNDVWHWHPFPRPEPTAAKDLPTDKEVREALSLLKDEAYAIFARWDRADKLAAKGRNLLGIRRRIGVLGSFEFEVTEADAHATYRALIEQTGDPIPTIYVLRRALGLNDDNRTLPGWWPKHSHDHPRAGKPVLIEDIVAGLYPTRDDIESLALLFIARSGWNPATTLSIDVTNPSWPSRTVIRAQTYGESRHSKSVRALGNGHSLAEDTRLVATGSLLKSTREPRHCVLLSSSKVVAR